MTRVLVLLSVVLFFLLWRNRVSAAEQPLSSPRGIESRIHPILGCLKRPDVGTCLQKSVFGFLEDWLLNGEDANGLDRADEDLASMHPYLAKVVDGLADAITLYNSGGADADDDDDDEVETAREARSDALDIPQEGRLHRKKKLIRKAVRRAIIKLILIALLIKHKIKLLLHGFTTLVQLKFLLLTGLYVVANAIKVWAEIKHKHHPHKIIYYENSHHHHGGENHYGGVDHVDHGAGYGTDPYGDYNNAWKKQQQL